MKKLSIRMKITLWFAGALVLMVTLTYGVLLSVSHQVIQKTETHSQNRFFKVFLLPMGLWIVIK